MTQVDWQRLVDDDFRLPEGHRLDDLTAELTTMLGSPDPLLRDGIALPVLATWIERGTYDDLLAGLGDGMAAGLTQGLGDQGSDSVHRRSFSALVLARCLARTDERDLLPHAKVLEWGDRLCTWWTRERDVRGFVPGQGWAHAIAHGADGIGVLAGSAALGRPELTALLDVIADRVLAPSDPWLHGEPDRVALATLAVLRRGEVPIEVTEAWVARIGAGANAFDGSTPDDEDPFAPAANPQAFLRALHLQTVLTPQPPAERADLLLAVVGALRETNTAYLHVTDQ